MMQTPMNFPTFFPWIIGLRTLRNVSTRELLNEGIVGKSGPGGGRRTAASAGVGRAGTSTLGLRRE